MATLFISDLHLDAGQPGISAQFLAFLEGEAHSAEALYILGDLFESWVGDDDPNEHYAGIKTALRTLVDSGVPVYFMHGNRDFLVGADFSDETGVEILPDPFALNLHGERVLLSHGDALCTDDVEYQKMRAMSRNPEWQAVALAKPLAERLALAAHYREQSQANHAARGDEIVDVNPGAVAECIAAHGVDILLHGHTHRPNVHDIEVDGRSAKRIVLGDWYEQGSVLRWGANGFSLDVMPRS